MELVIFIPLLGLVFYSILAKNELEGMFLVSGTIGQAKYLLLIIISNLFAITTTQILNEDGAIIIIIFWLILSVFLTISSGIRRLRDIGWNSFLILIPFVYLIIIFIPSKSSNSSELKELEKKVKIAELKKKLRDLEK